MLERAPLADLLQRLGIRRLGAFAALPASDVLARFGLDAALAHRLAAGRDDRPLEVRQPPADLTVRQVYDEPLDRVDVALFAARALAVQLHEQLTAHGLACTRLEIGAVTTEGQELSRVWRHDGLLTAQAIADRTRWELDGWLARRQLTSGITALQLIPHGVLRQAGLQPGLWGEAGAEKDRAHRAMHRVQGLLGPDAVLIGVPSGGRDPQHLVTVLPFGDERVPARPLGPWPGVLPAPHPALAMAGEPVRLLDSNGDDVGVDARLAMTGDLARLEVGGRSVGVTSWWGPWPVIERWWDPSAGCRGVRVQVALDDGTPYCCCCPAASGRAGGPLRLSFTSQPGLPWDELQRRMSTPTVVDPLAHADGGDAPGFSRKRAPLTPPTLVRATGTVPYAELHCHSHYSFLDGASAPEDLVVEAARLGLTGVGITDHDGFYGAVRFSVAARELGMPSVYGVVLSLGPPAAQTGNPDPVGRHLLLLARGRQDLSPARRRSRRRASRRRREEPPRV